MEKLWYHLSRGVLQEIIEFVPRSKDEDCPNFLLEIERVTPLMDRYILNLIDGTNMTIFCVTSAEYSKIFSAQEAIAGTLIRILRYWLFRIECNLNDQNKQEFKYIILISNAEILKLTPAKAIVSLGRLASKTPRIRGIVDLCLDVPYTSDDGSPLRFRLSDDTGSIGCLASGPMYAPLHSILKEGVKVELSHAMVTEVDPAYKVCDSNFELKLNQFSVLNIYNPDDLTVIFAYSSYDIVKKLSERRLEFELATTSCSQSSTTSKLPSQPSSSQQKFLSSSKSSSQLSSALQNSFPSSKSSSQPSSSLQKALPPLKSSSELSSSVQKSSPALKSSSKLSSSVQKSSPALKSSSELSSSVQKSSPALKLLNIPHGIQSRCTNGQTPVPIASLTEIGICKSWIRGVVEYRSGLCSTAVNTVFLWFHLRDHSTVIRCMVWEPICTQLNPILRDGMMLEIADANVRVAPVAAKVSDHNYNISLNKFASVNASTPHNKLLYRYLRQKSTITFLGKKHSRIGPPQPPPNLDQKYIDGTLSMSISSVNKENCSSWIRGIVEYYTGLETSRINRLYTTFFIRDNTSMIYCNAWEPICCPLARVLEEGMIIAVKNYVVSPLRVDSNMWHHKFELCLNSKALVKVFTADDTLVYENVEC